MTDESSTMIRRGRRAVCRGSISINLQPQLQGNCPTASDDPLGRSVLPDHVLSIRCLGALVHYLRYCLIDHEILSMRHLTTYKFADILPDSTNIWRPFYAYQKNMVLDSVTLANLEVLKNSATGCREGTLIECLDCCSTAFGRRRLRQWVTAPLTDPEAIRLRQEAILVLISHSELARGLRDDLKHLPDLERLLIRVHQIGSSGTDPQHPETRAILFDEVVYSRRKIADFLATLAALETITRLLPRGALSDAIRSGLSTNQKREVCLSTKVPSFGGNDVDTPATSSLLLGLLNFAPEEAGDMSGEEIQSASQIKGRFPRLDNKLAYFTKAFDHETAKQQGKIIPESGVDADYDEAIEEVEDINKQLNDYLLMNQRRIRTRLSYWGTGRNRFQIEVPESAVSQVSRSWELASQRKGFQRFRTAETRDWLTQMTAAEDRKDAALRNIMRRIFGKFSKDFPRWHAAVSCVADIDCLLSLAEYSSSTATQHISSCMPEFIELTTEVQPFIEIVEGLHPCLKSTFSGGDVIPNSIRLGYVPDLKDDFIEDGMESFRRGATTLLVTGPNMGGKSTLMRQTALLIILAHLGCRIPAERCRLTAVDRVFTRLGASDRLLAGESTFMVELAETAAIIRHASRHSLVLMDELGRGTSTHDGAALAGAVLHRLSTGNLALSPHQRIRPLTLFSTHYHGLVEKLSLEQLRLGRVNGALTDCHDDYPKIDLGHMACMVEEDESNEPGLEQITFLYRFIPGACPRSYGFNAARLAHLPESVTRLGLIRATEFERTGLVFACLRQILRGKVSEEQVKHWHQKLCELS